MQLFPSPAARRTALGAPTLFVSPMFVHNTWEKVVPRRKKIRHKCKTSPSHHTSWAVHLRTWRYPELAMPLKKNTFYFRSTLTCPSRLVSVLDIIESPRADTTISSNAIVLLFKLTAPRYSLLLSNSCRPFACSGGRRCFSVDSVATRPICFFRRHNTVDSSSSSIFFCFVSDILTSYGTVLHQAHKKAVMF